MASEISDRPGADLRATQDAFRKRRQELEETNERELNRVRDEGQGEVLKASAEGAAAISHVRQDASERLEQAKQNADQRLTYERKDIDHRLQSTRKEGQAQVAALKATTEAERAHLEGERKTITARETELRRAGHDARTEIENEAQEHRREALTASQRDVAQIYARAKEKAGQWREKSGQESAGESERHAKAMDTLRKEHARAFGEAKAAGDRELKARSGEDEKRLGAEREDFTARERNLKLRADRELENEQKNANERLTTTEKANQRSMTDARVRGTENTEKTRTYYRDQVARLRKEGEEGVREQRAHYDEAHQTLKNDNRAELEAVKTRHEETLKDGEVVFHAHEKRNEGYHHAALTKQGEEFAKAERANRQAFESKVRQQQDKMTRDLARAKADALEAVGSYQSREGDPFYHIQQIDGRLDESLSHYTLVAAVPEHEKDNIKVHVKNDKIVVEGHRRFADRLHDGEREVSSESYQTFHEVLPLEHPVREKLARQTYRDGILTVTVPKA